MSAAFWVLATFGGIVPLTWTGSPTAGRSVPAFAMGSPESLYARTCWAALFVHDFQGLTPIAIFVDGRNLI